MNDNAYRTRAERGEIQLGTWVNMIRGYGRFLSAVQTRLRTRSSSR